jgi:hypothetical protein
MKDVQVQQDSWRAWEIRQSSICLRMAKKHIIFSGAGGYELLTMFVVILSCPYSIESSCLIYMWEILIK